MFCEKCGSRVAETDKFCGSCGCKIEATPYAPNKKSQGASLLSFIGKLLFLLSDIVVKIYLFARKIVGVFCEQEPGSDEMLAAKAKSDTSIRLFVAIEGVISFFSGLLGQRYFRLNHVGSITYILESYQDYVGLELLKKAQNAETSSLILMILGVILIIIFAVMWIKKPRLKKSACSMLLAVLAVIIVVLSLTSNIAYTRYIRYIA